MNINYQFFLHYAKKQKDYKNLKILDYGCGKGEILKICLNEGLDIYGADVYHGGGPSDEILDSELYKSGRIKIIKKGEKLPFNDKEFDLIISNQVFEHVADIGFVVTELGRILKNNGKMYHHFPSKEVWREGHIGIPFSHWTPKFSRFRYLYIYVLRFLGFGYKKDGRNKKEWVKHSFDYLNNYCYYRDYKELKKVFSNYKIEHEEMEYIHYRSQDRLFFKKIAKIKFLNIFYKLIFRKLAFMAIQLKKHQTSL